MRENAERFRLASGWSHDVRTHLNILLGAVSMLETDKLSADQVKEYIAMIKHNASAMLRLINHLLDGEAGTTCEEAKNKGMQIDGLVRTIAESIKPYAQQHALEFLYDVETPLYAFCDGEMLQRVLYNLLSNAVKYTEPEGFVYLSARQNGEFVEVNVADTGCGLSEEKQAQLLGKGDESKLGLGLTLVKSMMRAMGASLSFSSRERIGTTFYLQFSAARCAHKAGLGEAI